MSCHLCWTLATSDVGEQLMVGIKFFLKTVEPKTPQRGTGADRRGGWTAEPPLQYDGRKHGLGKLKKNPCALRILLEFSLLLWSLFV